MEDYLEEIDKREIYIPIEKKMKYEDSETNISEELNEYYSFSQKKGYTFQELMKCLMRMWKKQSKFKLEAGLLVKDMLSFVSTPTKEEIFKIFPYSIIMTQACDIASHYLQLEKNKENKESKIISRQVLTQILFCPAFDSDKFFLGTHLFDQYGYEFEAYHENAKNNIKKNKDFRFHYFEGEDSLSIPCLVIDFKHYFTLPINFVLSFLEINQNINSVALDAIFQTKLSDEFAHYLQRVAIPD